jgi:hypothetical protein
MTTGPEKAFRASYIAPGVNSTFPLVKAAR